MADWFEQNTPTNSNGVGDWTQNPDGTYNLPSGYVTAPPINANGTPINTGGSIKAPQPAAPAASPDAGAGVQTASGQLSAADKAAIDGMLANAQSNDDPNYWYNLAAQHGGVQNTGSDWLNGRIAQGDGALGVRNGTVQKFQDSPAQAQGAPLGQIGTFTPPPAPAYNAYNPGNAPTPTPFVAPTLEQARNAPGFQSQLESANQGIQRSAVARTGLGGGLLKDLSQYDIGLADQNYGNLFNQQLAANQTNNGSALAAYNSTVNANLGAGNLNLQGTNQQFQNTYQPAWNAYTFGANYGLQANQQQFGQGLARDQFNLGAQNQYWNQGFNENRNAYDQYDNSQKTAFDQWYKTAQLGNPGNPYT